MNSVNTSSMTRNIILFVAFLSSSWLLLSPLSASSKTDTTYSVSYKLNMTKAVNDHIFRPDSDYVYIVMDHGIQPFKLVPGPGYTYTGTLFDELDSGVTYHYKFRINDNLWETVNRTVTAQPGIVNVSAWWNDESLNYTSFTVNMEYAVQSGRFHPDTDSVCIVGTMNNWQGSPRMQRIESTLNFNYTYGLDPGTVQHYKYQINADSTGRELQNKPSREILIPDTLLEVYNDFDNFNPARRPMKFSCNMSYYIKAHHFYPQTDFLDVAGNFNHWGANEVLFDSDGDSVYVCETYLDTTWFQYGPLLFKFRINGDMQSAEPRVPYHSYEFHDTINNNPNVFSSFYNNLDPSVPTPPWVYDVAIQGNLIHKRIISGSYSYENVNGIREDSSAYQWYRSPDAIGTTLTPIDTGRYITYTIDTLDIGKWLVFEVTPHAAYGDSAVGLPVRVFSATSIGGVGIGEISSLIARLFPNPATDLITIEAVREMDRIEFYNQTGQLVLTTGGFHSKGIRINVSNLPSGLYFIKAWTTSGESGMVKLIRQ